MKREQRYIVLKLKDLEALKMSPARVTALNEICDEVSMHRISKGKNLLECVVIESDWPEYEVVWDMLDKRVGG